MADPRSNAPELSVSDLAGALKRTIEEAFGRVRLRGEISGYKGPVGSGHVYFSLKDANARIDAVIWKGTFSKLRFRPEEGMEVIATGKVTTFPGGSRYQIVIDALEPAGIGALMALLEERRRKLQAEGLFDPARKQLLPYLPAVIGVVTSPTGAVIRDILHRLSDRFPRHVLIWPVRVQGETSAAEVAAAIRGFNALAPDGPIPRPDVLIVARGGGSLEDLWGFNEEIVVRAAAMSDIPLISAVGHETDTTLIDFVADVRAPTPTAAAEMAVPVRADLMAMTRDLGLRGLSGVRRALEHRRQAQRSAARALPGAEALVEARRQRVDMAGLKLLSSARTGLDRRRQALLGSARRLQAQTPQARLARFAERIAGFDRRMDGAARARLTRATDRLEAVARRLGPGLASEIEWAGETYRTLAQRFDRAFAGHVEWARREHVQRCHRIAEMQGRLKAAILARIAQRHERVAGLGSLLLSLGYRQVLARGFALVRGPEGNPVRLAAGVTPGMALDIEFADGHVQAAETGAAPRPRQPARPKPQGGQGSLF
jgi:exodeoxyribonuclease VII large subunit